MSKPDKLAKNKVSASTQQYLDIIEIKEDTVVMRDGTLRAVILASSINFALKSEDEQNAIISAYVSFLNNIDHTVQIVIQSRELDIKNYVNGLKQKEREQTNELLKVQTAEYIQYIGELISMGKIMSKHFYVTVPYNPLSDKRKGFFSSIIEVFKPVSLVKMKEKVFTRRRRNLTRRVENIISGLSSVGVSSTQLDTQSLIELFYSAYNPVTSNNQKLVDVHEIRIK
ncbi:MAG: hypothetical protein GWO79_00145 [Actinobacteria bacterium]|nr:hypothetical protein [Actinomycetota bacterium]